MWAHLSPAVPILLLIPVAIWGAQLNKARRFQMPPKPLWPYVANPGLALELADSGLFVDALLGEKTTRVGIANREAAARLQKLDFVFILLYVLFFVASALQSDHFFLSLTAIGTAVITGIFDVFENRAILRMIRDTPGAKAITAGKLKWVFYFITLMSQGVVLFAMAPVSGARAAGCLALGFLLVATGTGGVISSMKGSFSGISSAATFSSLGVLGLAASPLILASPLSWRVVAEYAFLLRIPLLLAAALMGIPLLAFFTSARTLLRGLFDLTPRSLFVVTVSSVAVAGTACATASLVVLHADARVGVPGLSAEMSPDTWIWLLVTLVLSAPIIGFSTFFSIRQGRGVPRSLLAMFAGFGLAFAAATYLGYSGSSLAKVIPWLSTREFEGLLANTGLFNGYVDFTAPTDPWLDHLTAFIAFLAVLALYATVGIYGYSRLGKSRTVPALGSLLMLMMMLGWALSAVGFFFDAWRVPTLLIVVLLGALTAQSARSDNFYHLRPRSSPTPAPGAAETLTATEIERVIVVAANGGGIQASAWAAQVLYGLQIEHGDTFGRSLRFISSVSGGSVGSAYFVHWLAHPTQAKRPDEAAAQSSLDEVAWGLAWSDFLRGLVPWIFGSLAGRGRALEQALRMNSASQPSERGRMEEPLSSWNKQVAAAELPAVIMNATIAETGERLLLGTSRLGISVTTRARVDGADLHTINGEELDVGVATAARLSASFPYVTPAARGDAPGPQPHVVDGGYYDNYGMSTLVEWLDEALHGTKRQVRSVLVLQIIGAPVTKYLKEKRHAKTRGWFYQAIAPLIALAAVRSAGQVAHNDIELEFLQKKWACEGITIHSTRFEFHNPNAPLSWHLTPEETREIANVWQKDMSDCREKVSRFLAGSDDLHCGCPRCGEFGP
jgi:hypothetical protein